MAFVPSQQEVDMQHSTHFNYPFIACSKTTTPNNIIAYDSFDEFDRLTTTTGTPHFVNGL